METLPFGAFGVRLRLPSLAPALISAVVAACGGSSGSAGPSSDAGPPRDAFALDAPSPADAADATSPPLDAAPDAGPVVDGTVTVNHGSIAAALPAGMAGLSYEKGHLTDGFFKGTNATLVAMLKLLGPSILRVGGNSVDTTTWQPTGPGDAGAAASITEADVDGLAAVAKAAGWQVIYGVNMKTNTPAVAADEAKYAAGDLGQNLYGFEIGNEVDLYTSTAGSATWSYSIFKTQWESFASAIRGALAPNTPLTGPASASHYATWTVPFATDEGEKIILLTQHYYRADGKAATSTMDELLEPDPALVTMLKALYTATQANGVIVDGYRIAECNSFYNGGAPGVSDAFGTALWAIDYLFTNALNGSSGANFHGGGNGPGYTPIADANGVVVGARPVFYGLLLFSQLGAGTIYTTTAQLGTSLNFTAYGVESSDAKTMRVVLVNKDPTATVHATVDAGEAITSATVTRLEGGTLDAINGTTLGGAPIDATGTWTPAAPEALAVSGQTTVVDVPPASAAVVAAIAQ